MPADHTTRDRATTLALPILVLFMAGTAAVAAVVAATPTVEYAPAPYAQTQSDVTL